MSKVKTMALLALLTAAPAVFADEYELKSDAVETTTGVEAWIDAGVKFEIAKWFELGVNESARFRFGQSVKSYTHVNLDFPINQYFGMGADYIFIYRHKDDKNRIKHRVGAYAEVHFHPGRWRISLKERPYLTMRFDSINSAEKNKFDWRLRSKLSVQYNVPGKPVKPYLSFTLDNTLNAKSITGKITDEDNNSVTYYDFKGNYVSKLRPQIGVKYTPARNHHLNFYYMFDADFARDYNITHKDSKLEVTRQRDFMHVIGVAYTFDIKR